MGPLNQLQTFTIANKKIEIFVPAAEAVKEKYLKQKDKDEATPFPYWAQVWPSSIALSAFILNNADLIKNKKVLELAGGLGLPSVAASAYASYVCYSDYLPDAIEIVQKTIEHNNLKNIECKLLNWHHLPPTLHTEVLLLSDVNYNPVDFNTLFKGLEQLIAAGTTVIISTPQRLLAKSFVSSLLKWCIKKEEKEILHHGQRISISTFVLKEAS